jgi:hypothetical protein
MSLPVAVVRHRLDALYRDVEQANTEAACPWPVARVFNALLAETREHLVGDPIVTAMASLKPADKNSTLSTAHYGTVRALVGQLIAALSTEDGAVPAEPQTAGPTPTQPPLTRGK